MGDSVNSGFMASNATANLGPGGSPPAKEESPTQREGLQSVKAQSNTNISSNKFLINMSRFSITT